jgi:hypothetical protein
VEVAVVDDVEEHIGSVGSVGEVAHLVNDEQMRVGVNEKSLA